MRELLPLIEKIGKVIRAMRTVIISFGGAVLSAHVNDSNGKQRHAEPVAIPARGDVTNLVLVISEPGGTCERCRSLLYGPNRSKQP